MLFHSTRTCQCDTIEQKARVFVPSKDFRPILILVGWALDPTLTVELQKGFILYVIYKNWTNTLAFCFFFTFLDENIWVFWCYYILLFCLCMVKKVKWRFIDLGFQWINFSSFASQVVLNKDPTVWLVGARTPLINFIGPVLVRKWAWWSHNMTNWVQHTYNHHTCHNV